MFSFTTGDNTVKEIHPRGTIGGLTAWGTKLRLYFQQLSTEI